MKRLHSFFSVLSIVLTICVLTSCGPSTGGESSMNASSDYIDSSVETANSDAVSEESSAGPAVESDALSSTDKVSSNKPSSKPAKPSKPSGSTSSTAKPADDGPNVDPRNFKFSGTISKEVLCNYLSRSATLSDLCVNNGTAAETFEDNLRMMNNIGVKFISRAASASWGGRITGNYFDICKQRADAVHKIMPDVILEAGIFECITKAEVNEVPIPDWVFKTFNQPVVKRNFNYSAMLCTNGDWVNIWNPDASVPDITRLETRMFFYYNACKYIDAGYEALHMGQFMWYAQKDNPEKGYPLSTELFGKIRAYAKQHARRKLVLINSHTHGAKDANGNLMFDFHVYPMRIKQLSDVDGILVKGWVDSIYGKSMGGKNPNGWTTDENPYIVEFDNYGLNNPNGDGTSFYYDEITWFAVQDAAHRNATLKKFYDWIGKNAPNGFLCMPLARPLVETISVDISYNPEFDPVTMTTNFYRANTPSDKCLLGFDVEKTIKSLWKIK